MVNVRLNFTGGGNIVRQAQAEAQDWMVGSIVNYAAVQELDPKQGRPYLRPALKETEAAVKNLGQTTLSNFIGVVSFEIERRAKIKVKVDTGNLRASIAAAPEPMFDSASEQSLRSGFRQRGKDGTKKVDSPDDILGSD